MKAQENKAVKSNEMTATQALGHALTMLRAIARGKSFDAETFYEKVDSMERALAKAPTGRPRKTTPCTCGYELSAREDRGSCPRCGLSPAQREAKRCAAIANEAMLDVADHLAGTVVMAQVAACDAELEALRRKQQRRTRQNARDAARLMRLRELEARDPHALDSADRAEMQLLATRAAARMVR